METTAKTGYCKYCHEQRIVEVPENATEEMRNEEAANNCNCYAAQSAREKEHQKEACITNITKC